MTDNAGSRTYGYGYDSSGRLQTYTDPLTNITQYGYDSNNNLNQITDPRGHNILITYDSQKRVSSVTRVTDTVHNTGPTWTFAYPSGTTGCAAGHGATGMSTVTDPDSHTTTYCFDHLGQVVQTIDARSLHHYSTFDPNGNITNFEQLSGSATGNADWNFTYSSGGQGMDVSTVQLPVSGSGQTPATETICRGGTCPDSSHRDLGSGPAGFPTSIYGFNNDSTGSTATPTYHYTYDNTSTDKNYGDILTASSPDDGTTQYAWGNPTGSVNPDMQVLETITDPDGHVTSFGYDSEGNLTSITRPSPGHGDVTITYDALSRVHTVTDGNGVTATYTYDALDHVKSISFSDSTHSVVYGYDENGNLTSRVDAIGTWGFNYDELNRRTLETRPSPDANVSYTYYDSGPVHTITDGSGTTTYAYNPVNLPTSIKDPQNAETTISYQPHTNQIDTITYPNGVTVAHTWQDAGQLATLIAKNPSGTTIISRTYNYKDPSNSTQDFTRLNTATDNLASTTTNYSYNVEDRLKSAVVGSVGPSYTYSNEGNLTQLTQGGSTTYYTYNADNELTCTSTLTGCTGTTTTYGYDADGNRTSSSAGFSASYNGLHQMTTGTNTYADTGQTLRIGSGSKHFTYTQLGMASENNGTTTTNYLRSSDGTLLGLATGTGSSSKQYYILDNLGSVIGTTNSTGALTSYTYDPYGKSTGSTTPSAWGFASGYRDSSGPTTGMYQFGTRYYDPATQRWTQLDPKAGTLDQPMSQNGYLYVNDDPPNSVDPSGEFSTLQITATVFGLGVAEAVCETTLFSLPAEATTGTVVLAAAVCASSAAIAVTPLFVSSITSLAGSIGL